VSGYVALDHQLAVDVVERIYHDPAFAPVWKALKEFLKKPRRHLVIIVGNHDIELSLPGVEASIRHQLTAGDTDAQSRLIFSTHSSGFACKVGGKRVFCTHGNEVDAWNVVNYDLLGQLGNAMNAGRSADADQWQPNAGARLVC
jgi:predicted phosphodiesterase